MSDDLRAEIEAMRERAEGATPGPWKLWGMSVMADPVGNSDLDDAIDVASTHMTIDGKPRTFDATFIAAARSDVPRLVAALEAVVGLHAPEWTTDHHGGGYYRCQADAWTLDDQTPICPTVRAITAALTTKGSTDGH